MDSMHNIGYVSFEKPQGDFRIFNSDNFTIIVVKASSIQTHLAAITGFKVLRREVYLH